MNRENTETNMMMSAEWWAHALGWGSLAVLGVGAVLFAVLALAPYGFLSDFPQDVQDAAEAPTRGQRIAGRVGGGVFMAAIAVGLGAVLLAWGRQHPEAGWIDHVAMALVLAVMFALFDLLIIDWLIICLWRPAFILLPGTEECAGWRDYGFHVREQVSVKGLSALVIMSIVLGTGAWLL